jgi:hypothetical protein
MNRKASQGGLPTTTFAHPAPKDSASGRDRLRAT